MAAQVTLQGFEFFAVFEADEIVGGEGFLDRDGWFYFRRFLAGGWITHGAGKGAMNLADQLWKLRLGNRVLADIGRDDFRREIDQISFCFQNIGHRKPLG